MKGMRRFIYSLSKSEGRNRRGSLRALIMVEINRTIESDLRMVPKECAPGARVSALAPAPAAPPARARSPRLCRRRRARRESCEQRSTSHELGRSLIGRPPHRGGVVGNVLAIENVAAAVHTDRARSTAEFAAANATNDQMRR